MDYVVNVNRCPLKECILMYMYLILNALGCKMNGFFILKASSDDEFRLIDSMVFNANFNIVSITSRQPVHPSILTWCSFNQYPEQYSF